MISVEKKSGRSTSCDASAIRSMSGRRAVGPVLGDVAVDRLDDDDRAIDDDPEIDRPDREQVRRLALHVQDGDRVEKRERDDQGDDAGARQVAEEDEEDGDHQADADKQVVQHVMRRDVDEVRPLIEDPDPHAPGQELLALDLRHLRGDRLGGRQGLFVLPHQDDAFDDVVLGAAADDPLAGLVPDDHLGDLPDVDRACRRAPWR